MPNLPVPLFFRFTKDHVLVTLAEAKSLDAANVPDLRPSSSPPRPTSQVATHLHIDRLPDDVKKVVFAQWELQANDGMRRARPGETPAQTKLRQWLLEQTLPGIQACPQRRPDAHDDPRPRHAGRQGRIARLDARFTARPGSPLAKMIAALDRRPGLASAGPRRPQAVRPRHEARACPTTPRSRSPRSSDAVLAEAVQNAPKDQQIPLQFVANAFKPTLQAGDLDLKLAVTAGRKPGTLELFGAVKVVKGTEVEKLLQLVGGFAPPEAAKFEFDTKTVEGVKLHAVTVKSPEMLAAFGTQTLHLGTSDGRLLFALEGTGQALEAVAAAKPADAAVYANAIALATLAATAEKELPAPAVRKLYQAAFGVELGTDPGRGADAFDLRVAGGEALTARLTVSGKTLKFVTALDAEKKKEK